MFTHSQQEDCPLIPPKGLQHTHLTPRPHPSYPTLPLALSLHTPVIHQMLLPAGASVGWIGGNPAGPLSLVCWCLLSLVCIPVHGGLRLRPPTSFPTTQHSQVFPTYIMCFHPCVHSCPYFGSEKVLSFSDQDGKPHHCFCLFVLKQIILVCLQTYDAWELLLKYL